MTDHNTKQSKKEEIPSSVLLDLIIRINDLLNVMRMRNEKLQPEIDEIQNLINNFLSLNSALKNKADAGPVKNEEREPIYNDIWREGDKLYGG